MGPFPFLSGSDFIRAMLLGSPREHTARFLHFYIKTKQAKGIGGSKDTTSKGNMVYMSGDYTQERLSKVGRD